MQIGLIWFFHSNNIAQNELKLKTNKFPESDNKELPYHSSYFSSEKYYEDSYANLPKFESNFDDEKIYGGILPHHLMVNNYISAFFSGLENEKINTVILIGPNHFNVGKEKIITSRAIWQTPYGELKPNLNLISKISSVQDVEIDETPFVNEHSISGLVGFIKKSLPNVQFVPIILKENTDVELAEDLVDIIYNNIDFKDTLILSSVDFSHYLPANVADFHDERSNGIIRSFDFERIYDMEIDSPPSIYVVLKYLKKIKAQKSTLLFHTNSGVLVNNFDEPTTTHNFYYFQKGEAIGSKSVNMMFFGDLMLDRDVKTMIEKKSFYKMFEKIKGEENRFFRGVDIIGANFEGALTNNGEHYKPEMVYDFAFSTSTVKMLQKYNFNYFTLANNHFSDQGERGIIETRGNLNSLDFYFSGCKDRKVDEECSSEIIEISGTKIGLIGFSMVYGLIDLEKAKKIVEDIASSTDFAVINIHWGVEYEHKFNSVQKNIAHALIDSGADVIIGHHPHVVQGMEIYKNKPIFYSLGNFIFDQSVGYFPIDNRQGLIVGINFSNESIKYNLFPFSFEKFQLELIKGKAKEVFINNFKSWSVNSDQLESAFVKGNMEFKL